MYSHKTIFIIRVILPKNGLIFFLKFLSDGTNNILIYQLEVGDEMLNDKR